ncbi:hypothetical protein [Streptomyces griseocarneus]|uniref:hypothetical protein n=1 Tax=Streptomyces griseocarneus TaxID=51201 RepID=UPI00167EF341|nr:hypothetical protein [Streptomyces griseocarneus]MBZ6475215.1 hypothetical protein [Streptomyces griseocarneus]GHG61613.1 hypothetical protein GCM10018779_29640 [Streptomyces griseocarneus]
MCQGSERPTPLDRALVGATVLAETFDDYDARGALARIAGHVLWNRAGIAGRDPDADPYGSTPRTGPDAAGRPPFADGWLIARRRTALHECATEELGALSSRVVRDRSAVAAMALLVDDPATIDPGGALTFACLLYLADRHEAAQFWWQFAAGAGSATAAHCLYLHHLQHSERQAARWWYAQATALHEQGGEWILDAPPAPVPGDEPSSRFHVPECRARPLAEPAREASRESSRRKSAAADPGVSSPERWWMFTSRLTDVVRRLETDSDADFGTVPRPAPDLAAALEGCVGTAG